MWLAGPKAGGMDKTHKLLYFALASGPFPSVITSARGRRGLIGLVSSDLEAICKERNDSNFLPCHPQILSLALTDLRKGSLILWIRNRIPAFQLRTKNGKRVVVSSLFSATVFSFTRNWRSIIWRMGSSNREKITGGKKNKQRNSRPFNRQTKKYIWKTKQLFRRLPIVWFPSRCRPTSLLGDRYAFFKNPFYVCMCYAVLVTTTISRWPSRPQVLFLILLSVSMLF